MKATVTYRVGFIPYPFDEKRRKAGDEIWALIKVVTPEMGKITEEPVAVFNLDSEARTFQGHVIASKLDGKLVDVDANVKELAKRGLLQHL